MEVGVDQDVEFGMVLLVVRGVGGWGQHAPEVATEGVGG